MSNVLFIDPGVAGRGCAVALFRRRVLRAAWLEPPPPTSCDFDPECQIPIDQVVVERPEYQGDRSAAARPKDLMDLSWAGALLAGLYAGANGAAVIDLTPRQWKGSEPKPLMHKRALRKMSSVEILALGGQRTVQEIQAACEKGAKKRWKVSGAACYSSSSDTHNLLDAATMGCVYFNRLRKGQ